MYLSDNQTLKVMSNKITQEDILAAVSQAAGVSEQDIKGNSRKGADRKITHDELAKFTGIMGRTNQEMRDAALLAWVFAGFPIKIN